MEMENELIGQVEARDRKLKEKKSEGDKKVSNVLCLCRSRKSGIKDYLE